MTRLLVSPLRTLAALMVVLVLWPVIWIRREFFPCVAPGCEKPARKDFVCNRHGKQGAGIPEATPAMWAEYDAKYGPPLDTAPGGGMPVGRISHVNPGPCPEGEHKMVVAMIEADGAQCGKCGKWAHP